MRDFFGEIWSNLSRNRLRGFLTGFAVAWGIFILVILLGASNGLTNGIQDSYGSRVSNAIELRAFWASKPYKGLPKDRSVYFTPREAALVRQLPYINLFSAVAEKNITASFNAQYSSVRVLGVEGDYQKIYRKSLKNGRFINALDDKERAKVCVIDERTLQELGQADLLGKYIMLGDIPFLVVGVCENGDRWEGASVHIPLSTCLALYATDQHFRSIALTINDQQSARLMKKVPLNNTPANRFEPTEQTIFEQEIRLMLSPLMQFAPDDNNAIFVRSQAERVEETNKVMAAIRLFVLIIGICTLISGAVGVSNIMLVSVRERTKEFGIRKAIGAPPATILASVIGESLIITTLFGYIGMFVGIGIMELINRLVPQGDFPFRNPTVDLPAVIIATTILIIVGVVAGAIPALKAIRIKPIEALNYEK